LRAQKDNAQASLRDLDDGRVEVDPDELGVSVSRIPDLSKTLGQAPRGLKRQVFEAFCLQIRYDKVERRIEISAT
jgi:hypothetical protein